MEHNGKVLTEQEILEGRSNKYEFINFDETLEQAAEKYSYGGREGGHRKPFLEGAKWQAERSYSEEEVSQYVTFCIECDRNHLPILKIKDWFEQFKKK